MKNELTVAMSNRHCHLKQEDIETLFGKDYKLTQTKNLTQPGQFACNETIDITGPKGTISGVRILGPARAASQVEVLAADCFKLGIPVVIRDSGKTEATPGVKMVGPKGSCELKEGVIVAARHIHMNTKEAEEFGVKDQDIVDVETNGVRSLVFKNVLIRSGESHALDMHIDTEEGNAAGVKTGDIVKIIKRY